MEPNKVTLRIITAASSDDILIKKLLMGYLSKANPFKTSNVKEIQTVIEGDKKVLLLELSGRPKAIARSLQSAAGFEVYMRKVVPRIPVVRMSLLGKSDEEKARFYSMCELTRVEVV